MNTQTSEYRKELSELKPEDEIQEVETIKDLQGRNWDFLMTAGHGYLIVPKTSLYFNLAFDICEYGYVGKLACYLEEDVELQEFFNKLPSGEPITAELPKEKKEYIVNFYYTIVVEAENEEQAEEYAISDFQANGVSLSDYAISVDIKE